MQWQDNLAVSQQDPVHVAEFCGILIGRNPTELDTFIYSFGESLFSNFKICKRIDFLYTLSVFELVGVDVEIGCQNDVIFLKDFGTRFRSVSVIALRGLDAEENVYALRTFEEKPEEVLGEIQACASCHEGDPDEFQHVLDNEGDYWNFYKQNSNVKAFHPAHGFLDLYETRAVANLLKWATNVLGFENNS